MEPAIDCLQFSENALALLPRIEAELAAHGRGAAAGATRMYTTIAPRP